MAILTDVELLAKVRLGLGISGDYHDETLKLYIEEVKAFMLDAGVPDETIRSSTSVGVIIRGVSDLWNYASGGVELSKYFIQRVNQLAVPAKQAGGEGGV